MLSPVTSQFTNSTVAELNSPPKQAVVAINELGYLFTISSKSEYNVTTLCIPLSEYAFIQALEDNSLNALCPILFFAIKIK